MFTFKTPPKLVKRCRKLYQLIEEDSKDGQIPAVKLAKFMNVDVAWRRLIRNGDLPFAFGDSEVSRASSYIDIVPFWQYMTQGRPLSIYGRRQNQRPIARPKKRKIAA